MKRNERDETKNETAAAMIHDFQAMQFRYLLRQLTPEELAIMARLAEDLHAAANGPKSKYKKRIRKAKARAMRGIEALGETE